MFLLMRSGILFIERDHLQKVREDPVRTWRGWPYRRVVL